MIRMSLQNKLIEDYGIERYAEGYNSGYQDGLQKGQEKGYHHGYITGVQKGMFIGAISVAMALITGVLVDSHRLRV